MITKKNWVAKSIISWGAKSKISWGAKSKIIRRAKLKVNKGKLGKFENHSKILRWWVINGYNEKFL